MKQSILCAFILTVLFSCKKDSNGNASSEYRQVKKITYNNVNVDVIIDKPESNIVDVLLVFHGTVQNDSNLIDAAEITLDNFKNILDRKDMLIISVAHPQDNILFGDNIIQAEAALLWVKNKAEMELGVQIGKIFLGGHSQGGYIVTRLNTMHQTNGVIANAPGPLNLVYRCQLEESGQISNGRECDTLRQTFGTTTLNPNAYFQRSLLNFTTGFKSDILFVQGMNDTPIQLYSWPTFKQEIMNCTNCQFRQFVEVPLGGHPSLFTSSLAKTEFNRFVNSR
jgi:hypothetical protein